MSDIDLEKMRRNYSFRLDLAPRCNTCRHVKPRIIPIQTCESHCELLGIEIENDRKSKCPAWQGVERATTPTQEPKR